MAQIQPKVLTRQTLRLMEKFGINQSVWSATFVVILCFVDMHVQKWSWSYLFDSELCPNALHKRKLGSLRFLMYKRFVEVSDAAIFKINY